MNLQGAGALITNQSAIVELERVFPQQIAICYR